MQNRTTEDWFLEFWKIHPNPKDKHYSHTQFKRAVKIRAPEQIVWAAGAYARECEREKREKKFIKHSGTWLNRRCYEDYQLTPAPTKPIDAHIGVYVPFSEREPWDEYGRRTGKSWPRDAKGGWWFPTRLPPDEWQKGEP